MVIKPKSKTTPKPSKKTVVQPPAVIQKRAGPLYPSPRMSPLEYRPRFYTVTDTYRAVNWSLRTEQIKYGRELFATMPDLGTSIISKNSWAFSEGWLPRFQGDNTAWGEQAEQWLKQQWYPNANILGSNFDFRTSLYLSGIALDVDGESLCIWNIDKNGFPQIQLVPAHRIGNRNNGEKVVGYGPYKGLEIIDGVIYGADKLPLAYRLLGDTPDDDRDISKEKCNLLFEPEWADQKGRGISRIARTVSDWLDLQDIDSYQKRASKIAATVGLLHKTKDGLPDAGAPIVDASSDTILAEIGFPINQSMNFENLGQSSVYYLNANEGEDIESFLDERPSPNTEAFVKRIQSRAINAVGWHADLLSPERLGSAAVRSVTNQARKSIRMRQERIEIRAKLAIQFAIATAMKNGIIEKNYNDNWWQWTFTKPALLTIDSGNEEKADNEGLKLGTTTLAEVVSKKGHWWKDVRDQTQKESEDLVQRAIAMSQKYPELSFERAMSLLSQRTPNESAASMQEVEPPTQANN